MEGGFYSDCTGGSDVKLMTVSYVTTILFILCLSSVTIVKVVVMALVRSVQPMEWGN